MLPWHWRGLTQVPMGQSKQRFSPQNLHSFTHGGLPDKSLILPEPSSTNSWIWANSGCWEAQSGTWHRQAIALSQLIVLYSQLALQTCTKLLIKARHRPGYDKITLILIELRHLNAFLQAPSASLCCPNASKAHWFFFLLPGKMSAGGSLHFETHHARQNK